jgi:hypothetical protein
MEEIPMKRLAPVLAAAVLGTGCIMVDDNDCSSSSVTLEWDFQRFDGSAPTGCLGAGVDAVDVWVDGQFVDTYACNDGGATVFGIGSGTHDVTVEGVDLAAGRIAYRDQRTFSASGCGNQLVRVRPAEGTVNLNYSDVGCTSTACYLWFNVHDDVADTIAAVIGDTSPFAVKTLYAYPDDVVLRLPVGLYTLDWMEQVTSAFLGQAITCSASSFDVASATLTTVPVTLSAACLP